MSASATAYLLWAILSCIFLISLLFHLWYYDKFNCLKWNAGRQPGTFKRVMTYSYLGTLPMLVFFSVVMTIIKFREGFYVTSTGRVTPRPLHFWDSANLNWLLPLYFILSIAWSLELVTHLEELAFWLFLLHQGPGKRDWFKSWEFRTWCLGSILAVLGMPLTTILSRGNLDLCEAWIFLIGSLAGTSTTIIFLYVLARFPGFIRYVKMEGAEPDVVVRLTIFYHLNRVRVVFRFFFTLPLLIISLDGIKGPPFPIIGHQFALDFLLMMGGIGCFISSGITLLIFFPRSITRESGFKVQFGSLHNSNKLPEVALPLPNYQHYPQDLPSPKYYLGQYPEGTIDVQTESPRFARRTEDGWLFEEELEANPRIPRRHSHEDHTSTTNYNESDRGSQHSAISSPPCFTSPESQVPMRNHPCRSDNTVWMDPSLPTFSQHSSLQVPAGHFITHRHHQIASRFRTSYSRRNSGPLHPYVLNFTSPIDLLDSENASRDSHL